MRPSCENRLSAAPLNQGRTSRLCLLAFFHFLTLVAFAGQAPPAAVESPARDPQAPRIDLKQVLERRFESLQPTARPQLGGAVPGRLLLEGLQQRADRLRQRAAAQERLARSPEFAQSAPAAPVTASPGILLRPTLPAGLIPTSVVTGDFNGDGHKDFIVANGVTSDLWVYLGKGDGTFQPPRIVPLSKGLAPVNLRAADLRHVGRLDLIVAEASTMTIGILLGNGDGTFGYERTYTLPEQPEGLAIADFNKDGHLDIAVAMATVVDPPSTNIPYIALLEGDGKGGFSAPIVTYRPFYYSSVWNLDAADVNGDGLPDLLFTGPGWENSQIFFNKGDGAFTAGPTLAINEQGINGLTDGKLADINGDGCPDALIADMESLVWVLMGDCAGHFSAPKFIPIGDSPTALEIVDVNGDGHPDIVATTMPAINPVFGMVGGNTLTVALADGKGNFAAARQYVGPGQAYSLASADFNSDKRIDFVTANSDADAATVYLNQGNADFGFPEGVYAGVGYPGTINSPYSDLSFAGINKDAKPDAFFLSDGLNGELYATAMLGDGTGRFSPPLNSDTGVKFTDFPIADYRLGDFRNSGHLDLVAIGEDVAFSFGTQALLFMRGNGDGTFTAPKHIPLAGADGILAVGDFNRDGKLDFVAVNGAGAHTLTVFLGNGDGTFRALPPVSFSDSAALYGLRLWAADLNRDGKLDLLLFTSANGYWTDQTSLWEFLGKGDGTFQAPRRIEQPFQPLALADLNGDGWPDLARYDFFWPDGVTENYGPPRFTNYLGQPGGGFLQKSTYAPYTGIPLQVAPFLQSGDPQATSLVADLDGDGKPDEIAFQYIQNGLKYAQILHGNGDGTFLPNFDEFPFYLWQYPLYAHDLNGDGRAELVQMVGATSSLQVFKTGPAPALQLALVDEVVTNLASCGWVFANLPASTDRAVQLSTSAAGVRLPASVSLPAGRTSARFCYSLDPARDWHPVIDVRATLDGDTAVAWASQSYIQGFSLDLGTLKTPPLYTGQSTSPIQVTLTAQPGYSSRVSLSCQAQYATDTCQFGLNQLALKPGAPAQTTLVIHIAKNSVALGSIESFEVIADDGQVVKRQIVQVTVASLWLNPTYTTLCAASPGTGDLRLDIWSGAIPPIAGHCSGLPTGVACSIAATSNPYPGANNFQMILTLPKGLAKGTYPFSVTATSANQSSSAALSLIVTDPTPAPSFSPAAGAYSKAQKITLTNSNPYATIYYTLDGSTPSQFSTQYVWNQPIPISASTTVKAIAMASGLGMSPVVTAAYTIRPAATPAAAMWTRH